MCFAMSLEIACLMTFIIALCATESFFLAISVFSHVICKFRRVMKCIIAVRAAKLLVGMGFAHVST